MRYKEKNLDNAAGSKNVNRNAIHETLRYGVLNVNFCIQRCHAEFECNTKRYFKNLNMNRHA